MLTYYHRQMVVHPILLEVRQISSNQILMIYDKPIDLVSVTNVSNYWIRSTMGPVGIASVGMREALMTENAIRPDMGMIEPVDNSKIRFVITFKVNAMQGVMYTVLPCFVNLDGMSGFMGENWGPNSKNMFVGM
ncbi:MULTISPECIES: hypothetical protein [Bacillus]|uniref:hypothetical protein n=1 Tax=Bacillus TaxID=1386 RepID=UPI0011A5CC1B|nr:MULTISPECIES: hypothetical protein [Bacillus]